MTKLACVYGRYAAQELLDALLQTTTSNQTHYESQNKTLLSIVDTPKTT